MQFLVLPLDGVRRWPSFIITVASLRERWCVFLASYQNMTITIHFLEEKKKKKGKLTWSGKFVTFSFSNECWCTPLVESGAILTVRWALLVLAGLAVDATGTGRSSSDKIRFLSLVPCDFFWVGNEASDEYASSSQAHWSEKSTDSRHRWTCDIASLKPCNMKRFTTKTFRYQVGMNNFGHVVHVDVHVDELL